MACSSWKHLATPKELLLSLALVLLTYSALATVPLFLFPAPSLLFSMLPVSGSVMVAVMGLGRCLKRLIGVPSSAPALVLFHILFICGVHFSLIRPAAFTMQNMIFYTECVVLLLGLYSIFSSDPGVVPCGSYCSGLDKLEHIEDNHHWKADSFETRIRHCIRCKACIRGLDHHCPAFGNCIGQKNHVFFINLLAGFIIAEVSYSFISIKHVMTFILKDGTPKKSLSGIAIIIATMHFSLLQIIWQVLFLMWHLYCVCSNIKTDEWINWRKYPEFLVQSQCGLVFRNPYDKGVIGNIREFINLR